jgi:DNA-binding NtrC family response regulator
MTHTKQDTLDPRFAKYLLESMADGVFTLNRAGEITSWNASIDVPPLRHRKDDIPLLASHFIAQQNKKTDKQIQGLSQTALRLFMDHAWPGNVRELENAIEHAFVLCNEKEIDIFELPVELRRAKYQPGLAAQSCESYDPPRHRDRLTRSRLESLLSECGWNKAEVARRVGLSRTAIWKYMKKWDIPLKPGP